MIRTALLLLWVLTGLAFAADVSGEYKGTWSSNEGSNEGTLRHVLKRNSDSTWDCKFFYTSSGSEVTTKTTACSIDDKKLSAEYDSESDGSPIHIVLAATIGDGNTMEGTYKAMGSSGEMVDSGKWKASPQH